MATDTCEHRLEARGYWTRYVSGTTWAYGYVCGDCGVETETGKMDGQPHFGREMT